jgi:hypothetical protein
MIRRICTLIAVAATAAVAFTASASAGTTPRTRMDAYETGWTGMVQSPGSIDVGNGGSPWAHNLRWSRWTVASGKATGTLDLWWCTPTATCPPSVHNVTVWVDNTKIHGSQPYFSHMIYQYVNSKGETKQLTFSYSTTYGSIPWWH